MVESARPLTKLEQLYQKGRDVNKPPSTDGGAQVVDTSPVQQNQTAPTGTTFLESTIGKEESETFVDGEADAKETFSAKIDVERQTEDLYALRGGEAKHKDIEKQYKTLAEVKNADKLKFTLYNQKPKNRELFEKWANIFLPEYQAVHALFKHELFKEIEYNPKEAKYMKNTFRINCTYGDRLKINTKKFRDYWAIENITVALVRRNYAKLEENNEKVKFWEKKLDSFVQIYAKKIKQSVETFDYKKLYLFEEEPAPKTGKEKFTEATTQVTSFWRNEEKQKLAKLAEAVLIFKKEYLDRVSKQKGFSDDAEANYKADADMHAKEYAVERYSDPRLALPEKEKEEVIKLIPELFS